MTHLPAAQKQLQRPAPQQQHVITSCAGVRNRLCVCYVILGSQRLVEIQVPARQQNIIFVCGFCALRKAVFVSEIWGPPLQNENELGTGACCFGMELASASARIYELDEFDARHGLFARAHNLCNEQLATWRLWRKTAQPPRQATETAHTCLLACALVCTTCACIEHPLNLRNVCRST